MALHRINVSLVTSLDGQETRMMGSINSMQSVWVETKRLDTLTGQIFNEFRGVRKGAEVDGILSFVWSTARYDRHIRLNKPILR